VVGESLSPEMGGGFAQGMGRSHCLSIKIFYKIFFAFE